jgi:hypothetical protein
MNAPDSVTFRARSNAPVVPMAVALVIATLFVLLRWLDAAHRQLGIFVVAASRYSSSSRVPKGLPVGSGPGYDGQFYYRLALDPWDLAHTAFGITFDSFSRVERIGYPFLAWLVAWGHHASVPLALVIVNVAACGVVALAGGLLAQSSGRHAIWGLVFSGYWGYLWTLGRDLTELTAAAFVLLGLAAFVRQAPVWSGLAFLCAVLSKETSVLLVGALAVATLWTRLMPQQASVDTSNATLRSPRPVLARLAPRRSDVVFLLPLAGFVVWQLVLLHATGKVPIYKSGGENLGVPLVGLVRGFRHYATVFPSTASSLWFGELAVLILVAVGAAMSLRPARSEFRVLWGVSVLLILSTASGIWLGDVGFRSLDDAYLLSWVLLLSRRGRIWPWSIICVATWVVVFVELVRFV